jgi:3'-phosphoadenosine 5'-phosphosulfate sulfotransferase (PAPS reductase)/FAD synthetase
VIFLPAPPKIKDNPNAKPERLGNVIKRLAWCYRQNLDRKVEMANEVLRMLFKATDKIAVAFSGGRDSLVAMHLTLQIKPDVMVMLVNTTIEFPESLVYIRELAREWNLNYHEAKASVNFWKLADEQGIPVAGRGNTTFMRELAEKAKVKLSNSCCRRMKETPARQFYKEKDIEGVVTGLRVEESLMRRLNFADYGALRFSSIYNTINSWPLYAWTNQDIANYIQMNNLPLNPLYEMGYQRVGCWSCLQDMLYKDSRLFTLQKQHLRLYETLRKKFGVEMMRLLSAWADIEEWDFQEEHLDALY